MAQVSRRLANTSRGDGVSNALIRLTSPRTKNVNARRAAGAHRTNGT
jgi:hypothetical protein